MKSITFLMASEVIAMHRSELERHGGSEGVRDWGLLESALAQPQMSFGGQYAHADVFEMAAAYLFHLAKNHPFIDGNKRVAALAAAIFLDMNDLEFEVDPQLYFDLVYAVASGTVGKPEAAEFFRKHARLVDDGTEHP